MCNNGANLLGDCRMLRVAVAMAGLLLLCGCGTQTEPPPEQPAFYLSLAHGGAKVDAAVAASMISGYRHNNGLGPVTVDPELMKAAETQAMTMATRNKLDHGINGSLVHRLHKAGFNPQTAVENISAGYHTLAEAFSGWRDSPPHRANMLAKGVTKLGIAATYAPNTKYKVFWTLIMATEDKDRR